MSAPYIEHITLTTGHRNRSSRADVADETLAIVAPWLQRLIDTGAQLPLPAAPLAHYSAKASNEGSGLLVTIYGPLGPHTKGQAHIGEAVPLVTLGVAQRSRQGGDLWALLVANFGRSDGAARPAEPWCAVALHPDLSAFVDAWGWLGDFERCLAWAWITRRPQLGTA